MTACVNKKHTRRVALAISASLVGALSLGAATPVFANDISLLEATPDSSAQDGAIIEFKGGHKSGDTFVVDTDKGSGLVPTVVQPWATPNKQYDVVAYVVYKLQDQSDGGVLLNEEGRVIGGKQIYVEASSKLTNQLPTEIGEYAVFAKVELDDGTRVSVKEGATFSVVAADLSKATLYQVDADNPDITSDTDFVFDGSDWQLTGQPVSNFVTLGSYNRLALKIGDQQLDMDRFTFDYYTKAGKKVSGNDIVGAGDYYVIVSAPADSEYDGAKVRFDFSVKPLDLAAAGIVADDVQWNNKTGDVSTDVYVNGEKLAGSSLEDYVEVTYPDVATKTGKASLTVVADEKALEDAGYEGSVVNSKDVSYSVVTDLQTTTELVAKYDGQNFSTKNLKVDFSADPTNEFDPSKVTVTYTDNGKAVETDKYSFRVVNTTTGEVGGLEMLSNRGVYTVAVVLDAEALDYEFAGTSFAMNVQVTRGNVSSTDIAFVKDGKEVKGSVNATYLPGVDVLDGISVSVKTDTGKELDPSEYTVTVTDEDGNEVVEAIDAGKYTVTVTSDEYSLPSSGNSIDIVIDQRDLSSTDVDIRVKDAFVYVENGVEKRFIPYTGDVIVPEYEWTVDGETWYELPSADYEATYAIDGKEVELEQVSDEYLTTIKASEDSKNYTGTDMSTDVDVSDAKVFADVPNDAWYSQYVYTAANKQYMTGLDGTDIFNPEADITRGDVAVVLWKMAGKPSMEESPYYQEGKGYITGFGDVEPTMYYAQAIAWAKASGIVTGYDGTDSFMPDNAVSRQELCTMLARYAAKCGEDVAGAEADLTGYTDAGQVAAFAQDAVDYLVSEGVFGQDVDALRPMDAIQRAEVAAMVVRLDSVVDYDLIPGINL